MPQATVSRQFLGLKIKDDAILTFEGIEDPFKCWSDVLNVTNEMNCLICITKEGQLGNIDLRYCEIRFIIVLVIYLNWIALFKIITI